MSAHRQVNGVVIEPLLCLFNFLVQVLLTLKPYLVAFEETEGGKIELEWGFDFEKPGKLGCYLGVGDGRNSWIRFNCI